jgi:hypothetical protein
VDAISAAVVTEGLDRGVSRAEAPPSSPLSELLYGVEALLEVDTLGLPRDEALGLSPCLATNLNFRSGALVSFDVAEDPRLLLREALCAFGETGAANVLTNRVPWCLVLDT